MRTRDRKKVLEACPNCIYCAGANPATTVDHMPPIGMFPKRQRPPGLFFSACEPCNRNASQLDLFASFFASIHFKEHSEADKQHFREKLRAVKDAFPNILTEMLPDDRQRALISNMMDEEGRPFGALDVASPTVRRLIHGYGAKCAFALHYLETKTVVPQDGAVAVKWFTNANAFMNEVPQQLFEMLPHAKMIGSGKQSSADIFQYGSGKTDDAECSAHWIVFGHAVNYQLFAGKRLPAYGDIPSEDIFAPGFLRSPF